MREGHGKSQGGHRDSLTEKGVWNLRLGGGEGGSRVQICWKMFQAGKQQVQRSWGSSASLAGLHWKCREPGSVLVSSGTEMASLRR